VPIVRDSSTDWRAVLGAKPHTPVGDLIAGLDEVASLPIAYGQLPRRAYNVYSADFTRWSDIAEQTPTSLLDYPKAGVATVCALLTAAEDAVASCRAAAAAVAVPAATAVQRLLDRLDERDLALLSARVWTAKPLSQHALSERLGVHLAWVQRNQPWAEARFTELLADPAHRQVGEYAAELRHSLGPFVPQSVVVAELRRIDVDPDSQTAQVLLHCAGPYAQRDGWFDNTSVAGRQQVAAAVDAVFERDPAPSTASLVGELTALGMPPDVAAAYLDAQVALRRFGDIRVRWGESAADRAQAVLHARGAPATPEEIHAAIGIDGATTLKAVQEALYANDRFVRTSRQTWGLRAWGSAEYTGIFEAICARIDAAASGVANVDELTRDVLCSFPDVAAGSVRAYLNTLAFVVERETVRRRTDTDEWPPVAPLNTARGAFRNGDNEIRFAATVTNDVLRGAGQPIHPGLAAALGVDPGQRRVFASPHGQVAVTWRLSSTNGPNIGSLRAQAKATGAALRDTLVLVFGLEDQTLDVVLVSPETTGVDRLGRLLGGPVRTPLSALGAALDCDRGDVAAVLRGRGEDDLAEVADG
jgi:hypothetical protein